jgi:hypothetical protein
MAFPGKLQDLLEMELKDVETPDYVRVTYVVCACEENSCGCGGWMLEAVYGKTHSDTATAGPVFTGDPEQIDHPYLNASSNGLGHIVEKLRGDQISGHVTLLKGERSKVAELGARLL